MKITHALTIIILVLSIAAPLAAGPYEDGSAAYLSGHYAVALRLWQPLADQGRPDAQYGMGLLYDRGRGVAQDFVQAHMWFDLSAAQGTVGAAAARDKVALRMDAAQIAAAQKLADEWLGEGSHE